MIKYDLQNKCLRMACILLPLACNAPPILAYTVTIENKCSKETKIDVYGGHLFWNQVDCTATVPANTEKSCEITGGICPLSYTISGNINYTYFIEGTALPACYDVKGYIHEDSGGNCFTNIRETPKLRK